MATRWLDQSITHDPANKQYGNCMQAALASVMNLPLEEVPHFHHDGCDAPTFWERIEDFLLSKGFVMSYGEMHDCLNIATGPTKRGTHHSVVVHKGELKHDPHPSRIGLIESVTTFHLVPVDPGLI